MAITDFLTDNKNSKEDLKTALNIVKEFKSFESVEEWVDISGLYWTKLEQLEEFLEHLVNGKELEEDTLSYIKNLEIRRSKNVDINQTT